MSGKSQANPKPTEAELELLQVLWQKGSATVREVHEVLSKSKTTGYTTTLKIFQKMADKGLVVRDESQRSHVYAASWEAEKTQRQLVRHLLKGAFGGSSARLVMQALSERKATSEELREIRDLLDELDQEPKSRKGTK